MRLNRLLVFMVFAMNRINICPKLLTDYIQADVTATQLSTGLTRYTIRLYDNLGKTKIADGMPSFDALAKLSDVTT